MSTDLFAGFFNERMSAGDGLKTSAVTTTAKFPVFPLYNDMPNLTGKSTIPHEDGIIDDDPGSDAVMCLNYNQVFVLAEIAVSFFSDRCRLAIIQDVNGQVVTIPEQLLQRNIIPIEVHSPHDHTLTGVDQSRGTHTDT